MRRPALVLVALLSSVSGPAGRLPAQSCDAHPLALVLSGGGAKGLAHIGVLRVMDSLGIHPDLVVGTSMGSIVGGMYASGYAGRDIDSLARALPLGNLFRKYEPRTPRSLGARLPLVVWEQGEGRFTIQRAAVREAEVNGLINAAMLRGNLRARGDFDSLPIPFRAVATDLAGRAEVVLRSGDLARAVRASMSIPLVFEPEHLDDHYLGDGALVANIPVETAREQGAARVIVSDATEHLADTVDLTSPLVLAEQLLGFLFTQPPAAIGPADRFIRPDVDGFTSLDFSPPNVAALINRGYEAARAALADYPCTSGPARRLSPLPLTRISTISVRGGRPAEREFVRHLLRLEPGAPLDPASTRAGFRALGYHDGFKGAWLQPTGPADSLNLNLLVRPANRRLAAVGVTYDNDLGGRMWLGAVDRRLLGQRAEGSGVLALGELRQDLDLGLRTYTLTRRPLRPALTLTLARERVRFFDNAGEEVPGRRISEAIAFAGLEQEIAGQLTVSLGGRAHLWHQPGQDDRTALGGTLRLERDASRGETRFLVEGTYTNEYTRVAAEIFAPVPVDHQLELAPWLRYGWADRNLPLQATFMLGGYEGFPGRHVGELRGNREALGGLTATVKLLGPLEGRLEGAIGQVASGGSALPSGPWEYGGRIGVGAETPIGPIRVEYGLARKGRDMVFVRVGEWF